jgi:hypothetical protein
VRSLLKAALFCATAALVAFPAAAAAQPPTPAPPVTLDGPSSDIVSLSGMSIARDGTGGLVYLKQVGGVPHVFASTLVGGSFQPPQEIDSSFAGASSQPVIAAGNGGLLLVGFINGGALYVVDAANSAAGFQAPLLVASGASNPAIQMSNLGKAYLAFTVAGDGGSDVRAAYYFEGHWALESSPLNASPGDDAGTGTGRPAVATAGDGVATVVWGEGGHIYSRRVWATAPSVVFEQADVGSLNGWTEVSAGEPDAAAGGDSSYVGVVFQETFRNGSQHQDRVLMNRLRGSVYDGVTQPDALTTPDSDQAEEPNIAMGELGYGLVTSARESSHQVYAGTLGSNGTFLSAGQVDSTINFGTPYVIPATAGLASFVVAWQDQGVLSTDIHTRYWSLSNGFASEVVVSDPSLGPTNAASGLVDGGDVNSDLAVAWVQGTGNDTRIEVAQQYQTPGAPQARKTLAYDAKVRPVIGWNPANDSWGPIVYTVTVDGVQLGTTSTTSFRVPAPLGQGVHSWRVTATNPAGLQAGSPSAQIWVDTVRPTLRWRLSGKRRAGQTIALALTYRDPPPGGSGVNYVVIHWGDGSSSPVVVGAHRKAHVYKRAGRYLVTVVVKDHAGNKTTVARRITIKSH